MAETSGFFDAEELVDGGYDREYLAEQWANYFKLFVGNGVFFTPTNQLKVREASGLNVKILPGWAWINGYWYHNDSELVLEVPSNVTSATVRHGVFVQYNSADRVINIVIGNGRTTVNRVAPYYELKIAEITVEVGSTEIIDANITDTRGDADVCGFVTGILGLIDSGDIFAQYQSIFETWMANTQTDFTDWETNQQQIYAEWYQAIQTQYTLNWEAFLEWERTHKNSFEDWETAQQTAYAQWFNTVKAQQIADKAAWDTWYANLQQELHDLPQETAEYLQLEIDDLKINGLSGSILKVTTINTSLIGKNVSVSNSDGTEIKYGVFDSNGECEITGFRSVGTITISATDGTQTASTTYSIPYFGNYTIPIAFWAATVNIQGDSVMSGGTVTVKNSSNVTVGTITLNLSAAGTFTAMEPDDYTFSITRGEQVATSTVSVTQETTYNTTLHYWEATVKIQGDAGIMANSTVVVYDSNNRERGRVVLDLTSYGEFTAIEPSAYKFTITNGTRSDEKTVVVTQETEYNVSLHYWGATVQIQGDAQMASGTVTVKDGNNQTIGSVNLDSNSYGEYLAIAAGTYKFSISSGALSAEETLTISTEGTYPLTLSYWVATLNIQADSELYGEVVTVKDSSNNTVGTVTLSSSGTGTFDVHEADTYTLHATFQSRDYNTSVIVDTQGSYNVTISVWKATIRITGDNNLKGASVTVKDANSQTVGIVTLDATTGVGTINIYDVGTYTCSTVWSGNTISSSVIVASAITYEVALVTVKIVAFATGTDAELKDMLDAHYAGKINIYDYWHIGDERQVSISAITTSASGNVLTVDTQAQTFTWVLLNKGGKTLATPINGHTECAFVIGVKEQSKYMQGKVNLTVTNTGGWKDTAVRTFLNGTFKNALPSSFIALIKQIINTSSIGNQSATLANATDYFAHPSEIEVLGTTNKSFTGEGSQFEYYTTDSNKICYYTTSERKVSTVRFTRSPAKIATSQYQKYFAGVYYINGNFSTTASDPTNGAPIFPIAGI